MLHIQYPDVVEIMRVPLRVYVCALQSEDGKPSGMDGYEGDANVNGDTAAVRERLVIERVREAFRESLYCICGH